MPRPRGVQHAVGDGVTSGHRLRQTDPGLAGLLENAVRQHVLPGTRASYSCAVRQFVRFVEARDGAPAFPVQAVWVAAWALFMSFGISVQSLKAYLSALRYEQGCRGFAWDLEGNELVRRVIRYVSRRYGAPRRSIKFPVTVDVLRRIFPRLDGWPNLRLMSHDDRVFAAASAVAVFAFLRGGEFLWSPSSGRPVLLARNVQVKMLGGTKVVAVDIPRPKARWWLGAEAALCLSPSSSSLLDPVWLMEGMRNLGPPQSQGAPAFCMTDGRPLGKAWMLRRTRELVREAGIIFPDHLGALVDVGAASWRSGGACTAKRAGVSDATICHMGRWASNAFLRYTVAVELEELKTAVEKMGVPQGEGALIARVGNALPADADEDVPRVVEEELRRVRQGARRAGGDAQGFPLALGGRRASG